MRAYWDFTVRDAGRLLIGLLLFELGLVSIYIAGWLLGHPTAFFDLDGEGNLPTWFSSVQLLLVGQVFFLKSRQPDPASSPSPLLFVVVAAGFIFLSADETAQVHETISRVLRRVELMPHFKGGHGYWIFIYAVSGLALAYLARREVSAAWHRYRRAMRIVAMGVGVAFVER